MGYNALYSAERELTIRKVFLKLYTKIETNMIARRETRYSVRRQTFNGLRGIKS